MVHFIFGFITVLSPDLPENVFETDTSSPRVTTLPNAVVIDVFDDATPARVQMLRKPLQAIGKRRIGSCFYHFVSGKFLLVIEYFLEGR